MENLIKSNPVISMSTKEIAELTGKRHDNVMADCRKMFSELNLNAPDFSGTQKYGNNNIREVYNLDRRLTNILITGYSIKLRAAVIDRLNELEKQVANPVLTIDMLIDAYQEQKKLIESQAPAVEFVKQISTTKDSVKVGDFAKILYSKENLVIGQNRLFQWFYDNKYLQDSSTPYQKFIDMGIFEVVSGTVQNSTTGRIWKQVKITGKGMVYLTDKILKSGDFDPKPEPGMFPSKMVGK